MDKLNLSKHQINLSLDELSILAKPHITRPGRLDLTDSIYHYSDKDFDLYYF